MSLTVVISGPLREFAGNRGEVSLSGAPNNVSEALAQLWREYPGFRDRVITEMGDLRQHLNIFVDGEDIRWTGGFATSVRDGSEIVILPALSGG
jgi:MoaD family protein